MLRIAVLVLFLFLSSHVFSQAGRERRITLRESQEEIRRKAWTQIANVHNYRRLSKQTRNKLYGIAVKWLTKMKQLRRLDTLKILPENMLDVFTEVVHYTPSKREVNLIKGYNIAYVPDLKLLYQVYYMYYKSYLKYGNNTPLIEVLLGIMNRETMFTWIIGDFGYSISPCQLHRETAVWLLTSKSLRPKFKHLIYFDKPNLRGMHHFYSQEAMVEFVFEFLVNAKNYGKGTELEGISGYNGCKVHEEYTRTVALNVVKYLAYKAIILNNRKGNNRLTNSELVEKIKDLASKSISKKEQDIRQFERFIKSAVHYNESSFSQSAPKQKQNVWGELNQIKIAPSYGMATLPACDFGQAYIVKKPDVYLFSYFRKNLDTTVFYHNKIIERKYGIKPRYEQNLPDTNFIYLYYNTIDPKTGKNMKNFVKNVAQYQAIADQITVHCSKRQGKIYVIPEKPVYYYEKFERTEEVPSFFIEDARIKRIVKKIKK